MVPLLEESLVRIGGDGVEVLQGSWECLQVLTKGYVLRLVKRLESRWLEVERLDRMRHRETWWVPSPL
jgi:hypothetical protein